MRPTEHASEPASEKAKNSCGLPSSEIELNCVLFGCCSHASFHGHQRLVGANLDGGSRTPEKSYSGKQSRRRRPPAPAVALGTREARSATPWTAPVGRTRRLRAPALTDTPLQPLILESEWRTLPGLREASWQRGTRARHTGLHSAQTYGARWPTARRPPPP